MKKIAIVSPSWNGPGICPFVFKKGIEEIEKIFNTEVVFSSLATSTKKISPQKKAQDIHEMFEREDVEMIIASIGGSDSILVLPFLDKELIQKNAKGKFFMGFSDTTTLLLYLYDMGVQTIHGPSVMAGFAQPDGLHPELNQHIKEIYQYLVSPLIEEYQYKNMSEISDLDSDWENELNFKRQKTIYQKNSDPYVLVNKNIEGLLWGGNLETISSYIATPFFDQTTILWEKQVLFFETSEEKPSIDSILRFFRVLSVRGILQKVQGILIGQLSYYSEIEKEDLRNSLKKCLTEDLGFSGGIITNLSFGHSKPQWLLPIGSKISIMQQGKIIKIQK